jgi:hypothetical protein
MGLRNDRRSEGWKEGMLEVWKNGMIEEWNDGRLE